MIRLATTKEKETVLHLCCRDPWNGTEVLTAYLALCADVHNIDWQYCDVWIGESESDYKTPQYLLCRMGKTYRLVGRPHSQARWEELHQFLTLQPAGKLTGDGEVLAEYERRFPSPLPKQALQPSEPRMICRNRLGLFGAEDAQVKECESLWSIYDVLAAEDEEIARNISRDEFTARLVFMRRGGARFFEISEGDRPVSVGGILLPERSGYGLIIDLCTLPDCRGKGYAAKIIDRLCSEAFLLEKTPALDCANVQLAEYYGRMGFEAVGSWRRLKFYAE